MTAGKKNAAKPNGKAAKPPIEKQVQSARLGQGRGMER